MWWRFEAGRRMRDAILNVGESSDGLYTLDLVCLDYEQSVFGVFNCDNS